MINANFTSKDASLAFQSMLGIPSPQIYERAQEEIHSMLKSTYQVQFTNLLDSGRSALHLGLLALKELKPDKEEVLVSAYTCNVVINAILKAGLTPKFIDISADNLALSQKEIQAEISPKTIALISQNTFGIMDSPAELQKICQKANIFFIEDLAHSLGATNKIYSDFAILSFGAGKIISSSRGGAFLTNSEKIHTLFTSKTSSLTPLPPKEVLKHLFKIITFYLFDQFYFQGGKQILGFFVKISSLPKVLTPEEKQIQLDQIHEYSFPPKLLPILENQLKSLPQVLAHRSKLTEIYHTELKTALDKNSHNGSVKATTTKNSNQNSDTQIPQFDTFKIKTSPFPSLMGFPISLENPRQVAQKLFPREVLLNLEWSQSNIVPVDINHKETQYKKGSCPQAEKVAESLAYLPTHIHITEAKAKDIVTKLLQSV